MVFVVDTNTLISAILKQDGLPMKALKLAQQTGTIIVSEEIMAEIQAVIIRDKFNSYLPLEERRAALAEILTTTKTLPITNTDKIDCRDASDVKFLRLALDGGATCIISGDADLKSMSPFRGIPILSVSEFIRFAYPATTS